MKLISLIITLFISISSMRAQVINLADSVVDGKGVSMEWMDMYRYMRRAMNFSVAIPHEKVYLHFDNTGYYKGETMWYKAYVVRADNGRPTDISRVLYVELVNSGGDVVDTHKLCIDSLGTARGEFHLDSIYSTGFYEVRAYTRYMTNWGNGACFSRTFPIFKAPKVEGNYAEMVLDKNSYKMRLPTYREANPAPAVHFYPEGGDLVEDLPSRVAFTAVDREGLFYTARGVLLDANKKPLQAVVTLEKGKGWFEHTPTDEPAYLRLMNNTTGERHDYRLPEARPQGITLILDALRDDYVTATLRSSMAVEGRLLGYSLMNGGRIILCDTITAAKEQAIKLPRPALPAGVNQFTVFDASGRIMAERLFFICPSLSKVDSVSVATSNTTLLPCGKVRVNLSARPGTNLSFSAMDMATLPNGKEGNALTWMLLSSEVKGYIANPEYYFEADDREHRAAADLLMMVQGWRRYNWTLMEGRETFANAQFVEDSLYLHGTLLSRKKSLSVEGVDLEAIMYNRKGQIGHGTTKTDSLGNYAFRMPDLPGDDWTLFLRTRRDSVLTNYRICIDRSFSPMTRWISPYETELLAPLKPNLFANADTSIYIGYDDIRLQKGAHLLPEAKVKARRSFLEDARASWESEREGQHYASIYYNVNKEAEKTYDNGELAPHIFEWLYQRNPLFQASLGDKTVLPTQEASNIVKAQDARIDNDYWMDEGDPFAHASDFAPSDDGDIKFNVSTFKPKARNKKTELPGFAYIDGLAYRNRPIVWIVNNCLKSITGLNRITFDDKLMAKQYSLEPMPMFIDEVKSIYISEDPHAYHKYMYGAISGQNPVTVFIYTNHYTYKPQKGTRRTYFQAFNEPETFKMEDYSTVPPMQDLRRTLYWAPDVTTDAAGHATVEFYNNSSCRQMYISCEGLTPDGHFVVNE